MEPERINLTTGIIVGNNIYQSDVERVTGNRLIALFMGADVDESMACIVDHYPDAKGELRTLYTIGKYYFPKEGKDEYEKVCTLWDLKYHSSWDWLKPVIDKVFEYAIACHDIVQPVREMKIVVGIKPAWERVVTAIQGINKFNENKTTSIMGRDKQ